MLPTPAAAIEGNVDHLGPSPLLGWARCVPASDQRLRVEIRLDGRRVGRATADRYRPDLEAAGIGDGRHGFAFDLAEYLEPGAVQQLTVHCDATGEEVWSGTTGELRARAARLDSLRTSPLWAIREVAREPSRWRVSGYLVPAAGESPHPRWIADGEPVDDVEYPVASPPAPARLWHVPDHRRLGFRLGVPIDPSKAGGPVIDCVDGRTGRPLNEHGAFYLPADCDKQLRNVPDAQRMLRVQGHERADTHLLWGHTACRKLDALLRSRFGRPLTSFQSILDWGCGCGRLSRHLGKVSGPRLTGVDIDGDNVAWCSKNLAGLSEPSPDFRTVPLLPPSDLRADSFDLIVGHSVMTHLREADQLAWLAELRRLAQTDAFVFLTINADTAIWWTDPPRHVLDEWRTRGFSDAARDPALDGLVGDDQYYRATFHRHDYVRRMWGRYFEVVEILPAFAHIQDMVVLRKRGRRSGLRTS